MNHDIIKVVPLHDDLNLGMKFNNLNGAGTVNFKDLVSTEVSKRVDYIDITRYYKLNIDNSKAFGVGNQLYRIIFQSGLYDTENLEESLRTSKEYVTCPDKLADIVSNLFTLKVILGSDNSYYYTEKKENDINDVSSVTEYISQVDNDLLNSFNNSVFEAFGSKRKEVADIFIQSIAQCEFFMPFMSNFSHFVMANELVAHYLQTGDNLCLKEFTLNDNEKLVRDTFQKYNNLTFTVHDYTAQLAYCIMNDNKNVVNLFFDVKKDKNITVSLSGLLHKISIHNFSAYDYILLTREKRDEPYSFIPDELPYIREVFNILKANKVYNLSVYIGNKIETNYVLAALLELRNTLLKYNNYLLMEKSLSTTVSFLNVFFNKNVESDRKREVFGLYVYIAAIVAYHKQSEKDAWLTVKTFSDFLIYDEDCQFHNVDEWRTLVEYYTDINSNIPINIIRNIKNC